MTKKLQYSRIFGIEDKTFGSGFRNQYWSGVLRYWYMSCSILKFTFCKSGPVLEIPDIEDLNLQYWIAGNGYIVPGIKDLQYGRLHIESL
jgi:hypothetical protein